MIDSHLKSGRESDIGARSTGEPAERYSIQSDISDAIKDLVTPSAYPRVIRAERTFWEKATAMHAYCLKGAFRGGDRFARHWYDLECLDRIGTAQNALADRRLAADVAKHKQIFFRENDASGNPVDYEAAVTGSLCLIPAREALQALRQDYQKMLEAGLLQCDTIAFDELVERLTGLQSRANSDVVE